MNMKVFLCLVFCLFLLTGCSNRDYGEESEREDEIDRINGQLETLPLDGVCSDEVGQCAPGLSVPYDEVCDHFCDFCWYCAGVNGSQTGELCVANICG